MFASYRNLDRIRALLVGAGVLLALLVALLVSTASQAAKPAERKGPALVGNADRLPGAPSGTRVGQSLKSDAERQANATPIPGRYIVVLKDSADRPGRIAKAQVKERGGDLGVVYGAAINGYSAGGLSDADVETLRRDSRVKAVVPDLKIELGTMSQTIPTGIERIGATENATADIDGEGGGIDVDIAVIDTGIDYEHPDLNVYKRANCVPVGEKTSEISEGCTEGAGADGYGHGTHVAGIIGARDNGEGVVGVAPGARLWAVRVFNNAGATETTMSWWIAGVNWVTEHASEIEVANMSFGCYCVGSEKTEEAAAVLEEAVSTATSNGVVMVAAAGNESETTEGVTPAQNPDVITVSALADYDGEDGGAAEPLKISGGCQEVDDSGFASYGSDDTLAWFSNWGTLIDAAAPGVCILSTTPHEFSHLWPSGPDYAMLSGTSMAAPHVAGAAALLASDSNPNSKADVEAIRAQIVDEGSQEWTDLWTYGDPDLGRETSFPGYPFLTEGKFDSVQEPLLDVGPQSAAPYTTRASDRYFTKATLNGGVNPDGTNTSYQFEYGLTKSYGSKVPSSPQSVGSGSKDVKVSDTQTGLKTNQTYHYRLVTTSGGKTSYSEDRTFTPAPTVRNLGLYVYSGIENLEATSVTLKASVNTAGQETSFQFQYVDDATFQESGWTNAEMAPESPDEIGSGPTGLLVSRSVTGIEPETTYHYRPVVENEDGTGYGKPNQFTTPADVVTKPATGVDAHQVRLEGSINPGGEKYSYQFEWGETVEYGNVVPTSAETLGADGYTKVEISQVISGLIQGREYHYRVKAISDTTEEVTYGEDEGFSTSTAAFHTNGETLSAELQGDASLVLPHWPTEVYWYLKDQWIGCGTFTLADPSASAVGERASLSATAMECRLGENSAYPFDSDASGCEVTFHPGAHVLYQRYDGSVDIGGEECDGIEIEVDVDGLTCDLTIEPVNGLEAQFHNRESGGDKYVEVLMFGKNVPFSQTESEGPGIPLCYTGMFADGEFYATWDITADTNDLQIADIYQTPKTESASDVKSGSAKLRGSVDTDGISTIYGFEYGRTAEYGSVVGGGTIPMGSEGVQQVGLPVDGLEPETTYHFRFITVNKGGVAYGGDKTFTTEPAHPARVAATEYPAVVVGANDAEVEFESQALAEQGVRVECDAVGLSGSLATTTTALSLAPAFEGCESPQGEVAGKVTVEPNSCELALGLANSGPPYTGALSVQCAEAGDAIEFAALEGMIVFEVGEQSPGGSLAYANEGAGATATIAAEGSGTGVAWSCSPAFICEIGGFPTTSEDGVLAVDAELGGYGEEEQPSGLFVEGPSEAGLFMAGEEGGEGDEPRIEATEFPATVTGTNDVAFEFESEGSEARLQCEAVDLSGSLASAGSELALTPAFEGCEFSEEGESLEATIEANSCRFVFGVADSGPPYGGGLSVECVEEGDAIEIDTLGFFELAVGPQAPGGSLSYGNQGSGATATVTAEGAGTGVAYSCNPAYFCEIVGLPTSGEDGVLAVDAELGGLHGG